MEKKKIPKKESGEISRREFLKDAGLVVGGAAIGSTVLLAACGGEETTKTVTTTAPGATSTVTTTATAGEVTKTATVTQTVSKFVCPYCSGEFASLSALIAHVEAEHPAAEAVALTKLTVNGETYELQVEPEWTLAEVLRKELWLTGTKVACDEGACGSCTVLVDGEPTLSCMTLAIECEGKEITTIEGLADGDKLHPIQEAFIENSAFGCGFCIPGMIMSTKVLLDKNTSPTEEEVKQALSGNLCRCTGYVRPVKSVLAAAEKVRGG